MNKTKIVPKRAIRVGLFVIVCGFLVLYLRTIDFSKLANYHIYSLNFVLGVAIGLAYLYLGAFVWRVILRALQATALPSYHVTTRVYAQSWMGRYIPGTVAWIAGKVYLAKDWGISKSRLSAASLLEAGAQVLATVFVAFLILGFDSRLAILPPVLKVGLVIFGLLVLTMLAPAVFNKVLHIAFKLVARRDSPDELRINGSALARSFGLYIIGAGLYGAACFMVIRAVVPDLDLGNIWYVIGVIGLANVAGMAVPIAPSGLGVKESVLLVMFVAIMPKETALVATIMIRLWSLTIDIIFFIATGGFKILRQGTYVDKTTR